MIDAPAKRDLRMVMRVLQGLGRNAAGIHPIQL